MLTPQFVEERKQQLVELKRKLEEEKSLLPVHEEMGDDEGDAASEMEVDDVNRNIKARIDADLAKIEKALEKIETGTYGTDDDGKEIDPERLKILPQADKAI